jgi:hypothetical protein
MTTTASQTKRQARRKRMVRKQIYIQPQQDEQLKRMAQQRDTSEAELIREAIEILLDQQPSSRPNKALPPDEAAWHIILSFVDSRRAEGLPGESYKWEREDGYDDERYRRPWAQPREDAHDSV